MKIKTLEAITEKWQRVVGQRGADYQAGVQNPSVPWDTATKAAESNYEQGVQTAISKKRFGKGVTAAGNAKWQKGALEKGVARWPTGVAVAGPDFSKGFAPYRSALEALTLPPRRAKRDPSNLNRVTAVVNTMIKAAEAQGM